MPLFFLIPLFFLFSVTTLTAQRCEITDLRIAEDTVECAARFEVDFVVEIDLDIPNSATEGDTFSLNAPEEVPWLSDDFQILTPDGEVIAEVTVTKNPAVLTFTLAEYVNDNSNVSAVARIGAGIIKECEYIDNPQDFSFNFTTSCGQEFTDDIHQRACRLFNSGLARKGGFWTREDQGVTEQEGAIRWNLTLPVGEFNEAVIADTGGEGYTFDCSTLEVLVTTETNCFEAPTNWKSANGVNYKIINCGPDGFEVRILNAAKGEFYRVSTLADLTIVTQEEYTNTADFDVDGREWTRNQILRRSIAVGEGDTYPLDMEKTADTDTFGRVGDTIFYSFTVTNNGGETLEDVEIDDPLLGGAISCTPGVLPPGEAATCGPVPYIVTREDVLNGRIVNTATVNSIGEDGNDISSQGELTIAWADPDVGCEIEVFNAISSVNNGLNKRLYFKNIDCYPDNMVEVYNRWGALVYSAKGYDNENEVFTGNANHNAASISQGNRLPSGTYLYVLEYRKANLNVVKKSGYLYIR